MTADNDVIEPALVAFAKACQLLSMGKDTLRAEMVAGRINAQLVGKKIVFRPDELRRYAAELPSWEPR
jgi:hypothetical protein